MKKKNKKNNGEIQFISTKMKKQTYKNEDVKLFTSAVIIMIVMALLIGGLFYINGKYITKDEFQPETTTTTTEPSFDNTIILAEEVFKQKDNLYYVMFYDTKDSDYGKMYGNLVNYYNGDAVVYTVDLGSAMNKKYYNKDGKANENPTKPEELVITGPTLIVFKKNKVTSYIIEKNEIIKKLSEEKTTK